MAERRMFSNAIVRSSKFLRMPPSTRLLYYDLGMAADDDGVVEAFTVIKMTGAAEDDLRVLHAKGFVVVLNEDLVTYITDWNQNNQIRQDRYHKSIYSELLVKLADGNQVTTNGIPNGNQMATEVSIVKYSLGKSSKDKSNTLHSKKSNKEFVVPTYAEVKAYCEERNSSVNPRVFYDYFTAGNWHDSKGNPVRNWKQKLITWEKGGYGNNGFKSVPDKAPAHDGKPEVDYSYLYSN